MPGESHARETEGSVAPRWWQRALPLTAVAVVVAAVTVGLAGSNDEIRLSTSRQEQPFVELGLTLSPQDVCGPRLTRVRFTVVSHLDRSESLLFAIATDPARKGARTTVVKRDVWLQEGATTSVHTRTPAPRGAYDVMVRVKDRSESLRVHCAAPRGAR